MLIDLDIVVILNRYVKSGQGKKPNQAQLCYLAQLIYCQAYTFDTQRNRLYHILSHLKENFYCEF